MKYIIHTISLLLIIILFACKNQNTINYNIELTDYKKSYFEIENSDKKAAEFNIKINNKNFNTTENIIEFIKKEYKDLTTPEQVWHFVTDYTIHNTIISKNNWLYNPIFLVNSAGSGLCGFRSALMTNLLIEMGEETRSWCVNGHVITEVLVNNRWQVYDPDKGVVYYNENSEICSFDELCGNTTYISNPINIKCITNICDSIWATSTELANMYATSEDNVIFNTEYPKTKSSNKYSFILPPKSKLSFPIPDSNPEVLFSYAKLTIPPQITGNINLPLIPYNIEAKQAEVLFMNKNITNRKEELQELVSEAKTSDFQMFIRNNQSGIIITYYINPLVYAPQSDNEIILTGKFDNITIAALQFNENIEQKTGDNCNKEQARLALQISTCLSAEPRISSIQDYLIYVDSVFNCNPFGKLYPNFEKMKTYIDDKKEIYQNMDSAFWQSISSYGFANSLATIIDEYLKNEELSK
jgi:hypothetical protein